METSEQLTFVKNNYQTELNEIYNSLEKEEFRYVETVINKVNNPVFTRYSVTLLIDTLILLNTNEINE